MSRTKASKTILWNESVVETMNDTETALSSAHEDCVIHCLWVTHTTPLWANIGARKDDFFNRSIGPDRGGSGEGGREGRGGHVWECNRTKPNNKSRLFFGHYLPAVLCSKLFLPLHCRLFLSRFSAEVQRVSLTVVLRLLFESHSIISMCMCKQKPVEFVPFVFFES